MEMPLIESAASLSVTLTCGLALVVAVIASLVAVDWKSSFNSGRLSVWVAAVSGLAVLWHIGSAPGELNQHFIGAGFMALAFGPALAFLGMLVVSASLCFNGIANWQVLPLNAMFSAFLPVFVCWGIFKLVRLKLPKNPANYVFFGAFCPAAISMLASSVVCAAVFSALSSGHQILSQESLFVAALLLSSAEAWLNGVAATLAVVWAPQLLAATWTDAEWIPKPQKPKL